MKISNSYIQYSNNNSVNFNGYRTILGRKIDEVLAKGTISKDDNAFLVEELKKLITKRFAQKKHLGEGMQNRVYKLDRKYVLRVPINKAVILSDEIKIHEQKFSDLKTYYGEPLMTFGNVQILKNASQGKRAIPAGVPREMLTEYNETNVNSYYRDFYIPTFAEIPQKSYDTLAHDMKKLRELRGDNGSFYTFDYFNPNNVVLSGKTLKMTDDVEQTLFDDKNSVSNLLNVMVKQMTVGIPAVPSSKLLNLRREIVTKIIKAGMRNDLPLTGGDKPNDIFQFIFKFLCKAKESTEDIYRRLNEIKQTAKTPKERVIATDEYLKSIF